MTKNFSNEKRFKRLLTFNDITNSFLMIFLEFAVWGGFLMSLWWIFFINDL